MGYLPGELGLEEKLGCESAMSAFTCPPPLGIRDSLLLHQSPLGYPPTEPVSYGKWMLLAFIC